MFDQMTQEEIAAEINRLENQPTLKQLKEAQAFHKFVTSNPGFYDCSENVMTVCGWANKNGLPKSSVESYDIAFAACRAAGLLLSRGESEDAPPEPPSLTLADIERMPSDEYKRRLADPNFCALVNRLEAARPVRPRLRPVTGTAGGQHVRR
jgi:hypothetical protein